MQQNNALPQRTGLYAAVAAGLILLAGVTLFFSQPQDGGAQAGILPGSSPERGQRVLKDYGCISCHRIPGVQAPEAYVGPPLDNWADRQYIAGQIRNTPENLISWIMNPQSIAPGSAMPNMGVTWGDAQDMAAYLLTLRGERR